MKALRLIPILLLTSLFLSCQEEETPTFTLTTSSSPLEGGKVVFSPTGPFSPGQKVTIRPEPNPGWVFNEWGGDASGTAIPLIVEMNSNKKIFGVFVKTFPLVYEIVGNGSVTEKIIENPAGREFPMGTTLEITPVPDAGWLFEKWVLKTEFSEKVSNENPKTITTDGQKTIIVKFVPKPPGDPRFYVADNGVTCKCENVISGSKGQINGVEYEAVNDEFLRIRLDEGADLTKLCTSLVTDMRSLFSGRVFNQPIGNWDVSNVTNMRFMFAGSSFNQPIDKWEVGKVADMSRMFSGSNFNQPIGSWDVSNVTNMSGTFYGSDFNQPIGNWDVGNVTNMSGMFTKVSRWWDLGYEPPGFNQPIGQWDVSKVIDMSDMFSGSDFNQPIESWNVSNVTNMDSMFQNNYEFNQDLSQWCVVKLPVAPKDFSTENWVLPKPKWGTCPD